MPPQMNASIAENWSTGIMLGWIIFVLLATMSSAPVKCHQSSSTPAADAAEVKDWNEMGRWDHNYSCIFDNYRTFSYLHIGYVPYFNISSKVPTFATTDECLDVCTSDCSCSAVVFDVPRDSCYQYHDYILVQSIQLIPVTSHDTITAYIKVQRGYDHGGYYYSAAAAAQLFKTVLALVVSFFLWVL